MNIRVLLLILMGTCANLFAAAMSEVQKIDKRIMPLVIYNITGYDMEFVYARTDPMNHVLPLSQQVIPSREGRVIEISCLAGLLLIPKLQGMLEVELPQELKERYFALKGRGGSAYMRLNSIDDGKKFRISAYLQLRDEHYEVARYEANILPLAKDDMIRDRIVDRCKDHLPASEGSYILGKRKFLRRSAG